MNLLVGPGRATLGSACDGNARHAVMFRGAFDNGSEARVFACRAAAMSFAMRELGLAVADTWADTTTPHGRLMLTVLGGLAEFEREFIRARTGEGRKRAQARGVKFGRPPKLNAHQRREAIERLRNGETQAEIARTYWVDATTIGRLDCAPA